MSELLIAKSPETNFLVARGGQPVWPVRNELELRGLQRLAELHAVSLKEQKGSPGQTKPGREVVLGLGRETADAVQLYAHLTKRTARIAETLEEAQQSQPPTVAMMTYRWWTAGVLEFLYGGEDVKWLKKAPGVILAATAEELCRQAKLRAAAIRFRSPVKVRQACIIPEFDLGRRVAPDGITIGDKADVDAVNEVLRAQAGVLWLTTHSDGIDASLGGECVLCPFDELSVPYTGNGLPRCLETGQCHRKNSSREDAWRSGMLFAPSVIDARIIVIDACSALRVADGILDPRLAMGRFLLESANYGALIANWEIIATAPVVTQQLVNDLASGTPVGVAVAKFNRSRWAKHLGRRMCVLGDPSYGLPKSKRAKPKTAKAGPAYKVRTHKPRTKPADTMQRLAFLRMCVEEARKAAEVYPGAKPEDIRLQKQRAAETLSLLSRYENAVWRGGEADGESTATGSEMRRILLDFLSQVDLLSHWQSFASFERIATKRSCIHCHSDLNSLRARFEVPGIDRRVSLCPVCEIIEDCPIDFFTTFKMAMGPTVVLPSATLPDDCEARVVAWGHRPEYSKSWDWPKVSGGRLAEKVHLTPPLPVGPLKISVLLAWDTQIARVNSKVRFGENGLVMTASAN